MSKLMKLIDVTYDELYLWICIIIFIWVNQNLGIFMLLMGMYFGHNLKQEKTT